MLNNDAFFHTPEMQTILASFMHEGRRRKKDEVKRATDKLMNYYRDHGYELCVKKESVDIRKLIVADKNLVVKRELDGEKFGEVYNRIRTRGFHDDILVEEWCPGWNRNGVNYPNEKTRRYLFKEDDHYAARANLELGIEELDAYIVFCPWGGEYQCVCRDISEYGDVMKGDGQYPYRDMKDIRIDPMFISDVPIVGEKTKAHENVRL